MLATTSHLPENYIYWATAHPFHTNKMEIREGEVALFGKNCLSPILESNKGPGTRLEQSNKANQGKHCKTKGTSRGEVDFPDVMQEIHLPPTFPSQRTPPRLLREGRCFYLSKVLQSASPPLSTLNENSKGEA